jgi:hypothetical protein
MAQILDLGVFANETLDIKLPDEEVVLHLRKPTKEMVIKLAELKYLQKSAKPEVVIERMDSLVVEILRTNDTDRVFNCDFVENELNTKMKVAIITAYAAWIGEIETRPN